MTTNITTLQPPGKSLPAAFQNQKAAAVFAGQRIESGAEGLEGSYGLLKYAGKVWSLHMRGVAHPFIRSDDGTARGSVDVIVVRSAGNKAKTYYEKYVEGSREKPICWSNDGAHPDVSVPTPPAKACAICPKNVFGSRITDDGKQAKACGDHKRTAVVLDPALAASVLGQPLSEPILLRIPAASLNDFAVFSQTMEAQGFPLPSFITRIAFDITKPYPKLKFEALRPLTEEEGAVAMALRDDPGATRIVSQRADVEEPDDAPLAGGAAESAVGQSPHTAAPSVLRGQAVSSAAAVQPTSVAQSNSTLTTISHSEVHSEGVTKPSAEVVQMPIVARPTPQQQAAVMQPEPGAEATESFDADLDAKINSLLG